VADNRCRLKVEILENGDLNLRLQCDTWMSGQCQSDGNIKLVRFLNSHEGDGAHVVFTSI